MKLRQFPGTNVKVSPLGMGCMRLPTLDAENNPIDRPEAIRMIRTAIDRGLNYVDTAYGYHGGDSEVLVGEALADGYREKVTLTSKLPLWKVEKYEDMEALLDEQLSRLKTDHLDFYLAHAVDGERFDRLMPVGLLQFFDEMKKKGKILHVGFSFHDDFDVFKRVVDSYPWELAQVQMNILDEFNQATMKGVEYASSKGIGVVVMEPLRGGALTRNIPEEVQALYAAQPVRRSPAEWAFRYLYNRPEVVTILSGMSTMEQIEDNLRIFEHADANCVSAEEAAMYVRVREAYEARIRVGCTGCEYCQPCPQEIKIPQIFRRYDSCAMFGGFEGFYKNYVEEPSAKKCVGCGTCEAACPQHIQIREWLQKIDRECFEHT